MFNENQVNELSKNKNVLRCSAKSITYSQEFKIKALKQYLEEGVGPNQIFEEAGFPSAWLGKYRAGNCLKKWKDKYRTEGQESLLKENRGAPGKSKTWMVPKDEKKKIEYLETKIAYLEAENDFLAKLRGLKRK
jgi:transposase-like protein